MVRSLPLITTGARGSIQAAAPIKKREICAALVAFFLGSGLAWLLTAGGSVGGSLLQTAPPVWTSSAVEAYARGGLRSGDGGGGAAARSIPENRGSTILGGYHALDLHGDLTDTAFVSMASDDASGLLALTMFRSLREVETKVPHLVLMLARGGLGSATCNDASWKAAQGRQDIACGGKDTIAAEIVSEHILEHFARLGVETLVIDPIPTTTYTEGIPGGPQIFWGMAFNTLKVFSLTQFRKAIWLDGDDYFVRNVDHLMELPSLTGSVVTACCHALGPAYPGGGIFIVEPSNSTFQMLLGVISRPRPGTINAAWELGDMQVIRSIFGVPAYDGSLEPLYPAINDLRHGYVGGLRYFKRYRDMPQQEFEAWIDSTLDSRKQRREGFIEELRDPALPNWQALDMRYDQCVGSFACSPERDEPELVFSVHFSCLQTAGKPSSYESEHAFMQHLQTGGVDVHTRYWFLRWYGTLLRATLDEGLPPPKWEGAPLPNMTAAEAAAATEAAAAAA